jgi:Tol biopolymer transport system component
VRKIDYSFAVLFILTVVTKVQAAGQIAFTNRPSGSDHIYLMNANGTNVRQLTNNSGDTGPVAWSFDGTKIAFAINGNIYRANADGSGQVRLSNLHHDQFPSWSKDSSLIYFTDVVPGSNPPVTYIDSMSAVDGSNRSHLIGDGTAFWADPHVSPDGSKLVMESNAYANDPGKPFQIYTCSITNCSGTATQITNVIGQVADPYWSPDGTKIATSYYLLSTGNLNVMVMNSDGSNQNVLTSFTCPQEAGDPAWSPDGLHITFEWDGGSGGSCVLQDNNSVPAYVYTMNANGSGQASTGQRCSNIGCGPRYDPVLPVRSSRARTLGSGQTEDAEARRGVRCLYRVPQGFRRLAGGPVVASGRAGPLCMNQPGASRSASSPPGAREHASIPNRQNARCRIPCSNPCTRA